MLRKLAICSAHQLDCVKRAILPSSGFDLQQMVLADGKEGWLAKIFPARRLTQAGFLFKFRISRPGLKDK